ncbi:MAG: hypothetical protein KDE27_28640 [Planctomycetes bacterium]|nr:hypothetical protein [Planctomycetota bacterium]
MQHALIAFVCAASLAGPALAQITTACLPVGSNGAYGCQSTSSPVLTNGVVATGTIDFAYDPATAQLTVRVTNTSPVVAGEDSPVITAIAFSVPNGTVNSATLISQSGQGGATPAFALQFTPFQTQIQGCFGCFNALLSIPGLAGGIGNAQATQFNNPVVVLGRTTFVLQLAGPGVAGLTADAISAMLSGGGAYNVATSFVFQGGGIGGTANGYVSSGAPCCPNNAMVQNVGNGCAPGLLAVPTLTSIGVPYVGDLVGTDVNSPATPNSAGLLIHGFSTQYDPIFNLPLPINLANYGFPGCSLYPSNEFVLPITTDNAGFATYSVAIPAFAKWCGRRIAFQAFFVNASGGVLSSSGLVAILGS